MTTTHMYLSNSALRSFKICRRRWALAWYYGYAVPPARESPVGVVQLGSRVHAALEAHYGHGIPVERALRHLYAAANAERPEYAAELAREERQARAMCVGYVAWAEANGDAEEYEVVATEHEVSHDLVLDDGRTVTLRGKLDQLVRRREDGALLFRDWKTVGTFAKANLLVLDEQMRVYALLQALAASKTGEHVAGGLYVMLLRSMRTARARGPFYVTEEVRYTRHDLNSTWLRTRETAGDLLRVVDRLNAGGDFRAVAYPSTGDHCSYACPFTAVCPMFDDGSRAWDAVRANFEQRNPFHYYGSGMIDLVKRADALERGDRASESGNA